MRRRKFLTTAGIGGAASTLAAPAIAQSMPELKWRLTSSFPKSLDTLYGAAESIAKKVAGLTDNKFQIRVFAPGEIVPALQALDAVQNNTVEMCHTASYYFVGKDLTMGFDSGVPFGLTARQQNAWMSMGGGLQLMREFMADYNAVPFPAGNTGCQMGGWFRLMVGKQHWDALPAQYKLAIETVSGDVNGEMMARYDNLNPQALRRLVAAGTQLKPYPRDVLSAAWKATHELYDEFSSKNAKFKKIYDHWKAFRDEQFLWFRVAELTYENFAFTAAQTVK